MGSFTSDDGLMVEWYDYCYIVLLAWLTVQYLTLQICGFIRNKHRFLKTRNIAGAVADLQWLRFFEESVTSSSRIEMKARKTKSNCSVRGRSEKMGSV